MMYDDDADEDDADDDVVSHDMYNLLSSYMLYMFVISMHACMHACMHAWMDA